MNPSNITEEILNNATKKTADVNGMTEKTIETAKELRIKLFEATGENLSMDDPVISLLVALNSISSKTNELNNEMLAESRGQLLVEMQKSKDAIAKIFDDKIVELVGVVDDTASNERKVYIIAAFLLGFTLAYCIFTK